MRRSLAARALRPQEAFSFSGLIEGRGETLYPLQCGLIRTDVTPTLTAHHLSVMQYLPALLFHAHPESILPRQRIYCAICGPTRHIFLTLCLLTLFIASLGRKNRYMARAM